MPLAGAEPKLPLKAVIWVTPCDHKFHPNCLKEWIEIKLECPSCRSSLPAP
jgi:hypothetical protein